MTYVHERDWGPRVAGRRRCVTRSPGSTLWCGWPGEWTLPQSQTPVNTHIHLWDYSWAPIMFSMKYWTYIFEDIYIYYPKEEAVDTAVKLCIPLCGRSVCGWWRPVYWLLRLFHSARCRWVWWQQCHQLCSPPRPPWCQCPRGPPPPPTHIIRPHTSSIQAWNTGSHKEVVLHAELVQYETQDNSMDFLTMWLKFNTFQLSNCHKTKPKVWS